MGCYCGSKLLHTKCIYTWLDVAPSLFHFHRLCRLLSVFWNLFSVFSRMQISKLVFWGSSLLVLKSGQFSAVNQVFSERRGKEGGIARSGTGDTDIPVVPRLCSRRSEPWAAHEDLSAGQGGGVVGRRLERSCAAIRASQLREVNPHCPVCRERCGCLESLWQHSVPCGLLPKGAFRAICSEERDRFIAWVWPDRRGSQEAEWWHL